MDGQLHCLHCYGHASVSLAPGVKRNFWPLRNFWPVIVFQFFTYQNKEMKSGNYFFDVCCENWNILVRCQVPTISYSTGITLKMFGLSHYLFFLTWTRHTYLNTNSQALIISLVLSACLVCRILLCACAHDGVKS